MLILVLMQAPEVVTAIPLSSQLPTASQQLKKATDRHAILVQEYKIEGNSRAELRAQLDQLGPKDSLGANRDAYTEWNIAWSWPFLADSKPNFSQTQSRHSITMILPRWDSANGTDRDLLGQWENYYNALILHELEHVEHAVRNHRDVAEAIRIAAKKNPRLNTKEANKIARDTLAKIRRLDRMLDERTNHGKTQGVNF